MVLMELNTPVVIPLPVVAVVATTVVVVAAAAACRARGILKSIA